jgi:hypothetical protein
MHRNNIKKVFFCQNVVLEIHNIVEDLPALVYEIWEIFGRNMQNKYNNDFGFSNTYKMSVCAATCKTP